MAVLSAFHSIDPSTSMLHEKISDTKDRVLWKSGNLNEAFSYYCSPLHPRSRCPYAGVTSRRMRSWPISLLSRRPLAATAVRFLDYHGARDAVRDDLFSGGRRDFYISMRAETSCTSVAAAVLDIIFLTATNRLRTKVKSNNIVLCASTAVFYEVTDITL